MTTADGATLGQIAVRFGLELKGDPATRVTHVGELKDAGPAALSFLADARYERYLADTKAAAVVLEPKLASQCQVAALISDNPRAAYARIAAWLHPPEPVRPGIHASAVIDPSAIVAESAQIGPHTVVGAHAVIGERVVVGSGTQIGNGVTLAEDCRLMARVTLYGGVRLGARVIVHAGAVIGADGFGIAQDRDGWVKVPQLGGVVIHDDVEIGANTTIDRGAIGDTVIESGVKLDNQSQIGHNVRIGEHTAIAACVGISGSTTIGKRCLIAGAVGIVGHLQIADDVVITGLSMVSSSITRAGVYSSGVPVSEAGAWRRIVARLRNIDELFDKVRVLERRHKLGDSENS